MMLTREMLLLEEFLHQKERCSSSNSPIMDYKSISSSTRLKIGLTEELALLLSKLAHFSMELVRRMIIRGFKSLKTSCMVKYLENRLHLTGCLELFILIFLILNKNFLAAVAIFPLFYGVYYIQKK